MRSNHPPEHASYMRFTKRQQIDTAVHTLTGLLRGIAIDDELNAAEIAEVINWCNEYRPLANRAPFKELISKLDEVMEDGVIDPEELEDLLWVCKNLSPEGDFYDDITHEIQILQGILHGIMADDHALLKEATELQKWLYEHEHLKGSYPYDELESLLLAVLEDGIIDADEQKMLREFFEDFIQYSFAKRIHKESSRVRAGLKKVKTLPSICAVCPEIEFDSKSFAFTGTSKKAARADIAERVESLGGKFRTGVSQKIDYLVVGSGSNPCWTFSCYGRKVEKAAKLRKEGNAITIVHESDFWDAVEDMQ
jgi:hypothetical protein